MGLLSLKHGFHICTSSFQDQFEHTEADDPLRDRVCQGLSFPEDQVDEESVQ
jgi:hypothetical protein